MEKKQTKAPTISSKKVLKGSSKIGDTKLMFLVRS